MKDGKFAIYLGKEYTSGNNKDGKIILRSTNLKDIENGFEPCEPFLYKNYREEIVCLKLVNRLEIDDYFRLRTKALYSGYEFEVTEEKENMISIVAMTGDYRDWLNLGMVCIDKGVYQKWIQKDEAEIKIIKEES
jgi:20S proteasome alpha/beta subunit